MTVKCPSCGTGKVRATFQLLVTYSDVTEVATSDDPTSDDFVHAECTNYDECRVALAQEPGDGRLRRAGIVVDGDPVDDDELAARWVAAVFDVIGHEHPEWAVTHNDDGTMTCGECGATAPGENDYLELADRPVRPLHAVTDGCPPGCTDNPPGHYHVVVRPDPTPSPPPEEG